MLLPALTEIEYGVMRAKRNDDPLLEAYWREWLRLWWCPFGKDFGV